MSDRTRGAVRTGTREGSDAADATAALPADDGRPADAGASPAGGAAKAAGPAASTGGSKVGGTVKPTGLASGVSAPAAGPAQPTLAGGPVTAGSARAPAPTDDATGRVSAAPARPVEVTDGPVAAAPAAAGTAGGSSEVGPATGPDQRAAAGAGGTPRPATARGRGPRRARLQLRHIDTWSALKISLVVSIALFFVWMVAVGVLFGVLNGLGVFDTLNDLFGQLGSVSGDATGADSGSEVITAGVVFGGAAVIGLINIVLMTALCTIGSVVYNLCSDLVGGLEVTLSERD
jgi:hypothetical protein